MRQLSEAGLTAEYLPSNELLSVEPALFVGSDGGAAFVPDDCQLDALRTVSYIEKVSLFSFSFSYLMTFGLMIASFLMSPLFM